MLYHIICYNIALYLGLSDLWIVIRTKLNKIRAQTFFKQRMTLLKRTTIYIVYKYTPYNQKISNNEMNGLTSPLSLIPVYNQVCGQTDTLLTIDTQTDNSLYY